MWFVTGFSVPIHQNVLPVYSNIVTVSVNELRVLVSVYVMVLPLWGWFYECLFLHVCLCMSCSMACECVDVVYSEDQQNNIKSNRWTSSKSVFHIALPFVFPCKKAETPTNVFLSSFMET